MGWDLFKNMSIFSGFRDTEMGELLSWLGAKEQSFKKGSFIYQIGDKVRCLGIVTSGSVNLIKDDVWGNARILDHVKKGQIFAETYACLGTEPLMVNVQAAEDSAILFLDVGKLLTASSSASPSAYPFHSRLTQNLLRVTAMKNLNLTRKIDLLTPKSIRDRVLTYLSGQSVKEGSDTFEIPFDRQQMADYLSVERSALSGELSRLKKEGLIDFRKNAFVLKRQSPVSVG